MAAEINNKFINEKKYTQVVKNVTKYLKHCKTGICNIFTPAYNAEIHASMSKPKC